jgi:glutathione S-transferase
VLVLFEHPLSPYVQKCKIALREKEVPFEVRLPAGVGSGAGFDPAFLKANPRGEVPALIDGEVAIFDSTIILDYIEDKWPAPPLLPDSPAERARARMIEEAMDTHYEAINWGLGEVHFFQRAKGELAQSIHAKAGEQTAAWRRWLEAQLGSRTWFDGARFGRADLSVVPYLNGSRGFGMAPEPGTKLADWLARVNERPSVAQTSGEAAAFLSGGAGGMGTVAEAVKQGLFKREYRDHRLEWMIRSGGLSVVLEGLERGNIRFTSEFA